MEALKDELTCPICMDLFREPRRLPCGHVYCRVCLQDMLTKKYLNSRTSERVLSCPECRQHYDLTFQVAGVDIFPRDFKLMRLVELCRREGGGSTGASDDEDETAVKTVRSSSDREESPSASAAVLPLSSSTSINPSASAATSQSEAAAATASQSASTSFSLGVAERLTRGQLEAGLVSFGTPASSLSDDSWVYVQGREYQRPVGGLRLRSVPASLGAGVYERGDDSWLLPSSDGRFPVDGGPDVRGSVFGAEHHDYEGSGNPSVLLSGHFDNVGRQTFQPSPPNQTPTSLPSIPALPRHVQSSDSSSDSDSESDERGDEGRSGGDDVSGSGSEVDSQGRRQQRSRLSRFFRSLVMSDSDSWDEDDDGHPQSGGQGGVGVAGQPPRPYQGQHLPNHPGHLYAGPAHQAHYTMEQYQGRRTEPVLLSESRRPEPILCLEGRRPEQQPARYPSEGQRVHRMLESRSGRSRDLEMPAICLGPQPACFEQGAVLRHPEGQGSRWCEERARSGESEARPRSVEGHAHEPSGGSTSVWSDSGVEEKGEGTVTAHHSNHQAVVEVDLGQGGAASLAVCDPPPLTTSANSETAPTSSRPLPQPTPVRSRPPADASDDSGDDYEAHTSMMHPRRKPRSRLKKFFTSLLSLSSSEDDDDEEIDGQIVTSASSAAASSVSQ